MCCGLLTLPNYPFSELKEVSSSRVTSTSPDLLHWERIEKKSENGSGTLTGYIDTFIYCEFFTKIITQNFTEKAGAVAPSAPPLKTAHVHGRGTRKTGF